MAESTRTFDTFLQEDRTFPPSPEFQRAAHVSDEAIYVEAAADPQAAVVVCLGATAAQSVFATAIRLGDMRGRAWSAPLAATVFVTVHPSAILRHPESAQREQEYRRFVQDLHHITSYLRKAA